MNTKKDFELIAAIIRDAHIEVSYAAEGDQFQQREIMRRWIADAFCREFKNMSTRFCPTRFLEACDV